MRRTHIGRLRVWFWRRFLSIDVKAFGAYGDGLHDDTAAIQMAIDDAASRRFRRGVKMSGTYRITDTIRGPVRVRLFGESSPLFNIFSKSAQETDPE